MTLIWKPLAFFVREKPLQDLPAPQPRRGWTPCIWREDEYGVFSTDCCESFVFIAEGPRANGMYFCCYCGRQLQEETFAGEEILD
jgi:hypothetical protein